MGHLPITEPKPADQHIASQSHMRAVMKMGQATAENCLGRAKPARHSNFSSECN